MAPMSRRLVVLSLFLAACASSEGGGVDATAIDAELAPDACVPTAELCDGADQDCDDLIDEDFADLGDACTVGTGACTAAGVEACAPGGAATICDATSGTPDGELCNGLDDDCDEAVDEGLMLGTSCDGLGDTDACAEGTIVCDGAGGTTCNDTTTSTTETCNGLDDDCVSGADDPWPINTPCTAGTGACQTSGTFQCTGPATAACNAVAGSATAETCGDGIDQDCNGSDVACPVNDLAAGAIDVSAGGTFSVDLVAAHDNDYTAGTGCGLTGGRDVYYKLTLPAAEAVYFDTFGSSFDTVLRIYAGSCTSLGALQSCADDACSVLQQQAAISLGAGSYCLVADQYSSAQTSGALVLRVIRGGRNGTAIAAASGTQTGTTVGAADTTKGGCAFNNLSTAPDQAYYFPVCPSTTKVVAANLCTGAAYDSVLYLRAGAATSSDLACNDDNGPACTGTAASFTGGNVVGPTLGWLIVDGYSTNAGTYTLTYTM
jgi:hypothetical protein